MNIATPGFPLSVTRKYESVMATDGVNGFANAAPSTYQKEADLLLPNGDRNRFVENAGGTFDLGIADGTTTYHFAATGTLETIADEFGNTLLFTYDANGRLQRAADQAGSGRYLDVFLGADGRVSSMQDHTGRRIQCTYDTRGALTSVTDPSNRVITHTYQQVRYAPVLTRIADNWGRVITT